jgi:hypothetical protein
MTRPTCRIGSLFSSRSPFSSASVRMTSTSESMRHNRRRHIDRIACRISDFVGGSTIVVFIHDVTEIINRCEVLKVTIIIRRAHSIQNSAQTGRGRIFDWRDGGGKIKRDEWCVRAFMVFSEKLADGCRARQFVNTTLFPPSHLSGRVSDVAASRLLIL